MGRILGFLKFVFLLQILVAGGQEIISVKVGPAVINGLLEKGKGQTEHYAFKGIQYATAERWQDPVLNEFKEQTYNATEFGDYCPQLKSENVVGVEECLTLNVFTRDVPDDSRAIDPEALNPVMVYIHAGAFIFGSQSGIGPNRLMAAEEKVVLVIMNYRLGILGYLSTGEEDLPGNWGFLDIITALDWIQKYIKYFGGNPTRVTVFGHSSGGIASHLLALSPRAIGKFHRAILISGNMFCGVNLDLNPLQYTQKVANFVFCPTVPRTQMINCLKNQSIENLLAAQQHFTSIWIYPKHVFVVDGKSRGKMAVLPSDPLTLFESKSTPPVSMMIGVTQDEGLYGYSKIHYQFGNSFRNTSLFTSEIVPTVLKATLRVEESDPEYEAVLNSVFEKYFKNVNTEDDEMLQLAIAQMSDLVGDMLYYSCYRQFLEKYSTIDYPVYSYVFSHKLPNSPAITAKEFQYLREQGVSHPLFENGVGHAHDIFYIMDPVRLLSGTPPQTMSAIDEEVAVAYTRSLVGFAKTGVPLGTPDPTKDIWRPIGPGDLNYFNISLISTPMGTDFKKQGAEYWLKTVPAVMESARTTAQKNSSVKKTEL